MRKILAAHALILLFVGCSSDSERGSQEDQKNNIIGSWQINKYEVLDGKNQNNILNTSYPSVCALQDELIFLNDQEYKSILYKKSSDGSGCVIEVQAKYNYKLDSDYLYYTTVEHKFKLHELTSKTLQYSETYAEIDYNKDGVKDYVKYYYVKR